MNSPSLFKGSLTTIILKLLHENKRLYGYEVAEKVKSITDGQFAITEAALYTSLQRLEKYLLVDTEIIKHFERPRKYYSLTPRGEKELSARLMELQDFMRTMVKLLDVADRRRLT